MEHIGSSLRKLAESRGLEITSSKQTLKKVEVIELVRQQRAENRQDLIYSARPFVLCGMPLKRPPVGTLIHRRRNGRFFLHIHGHAEYGLPFGQDRLVAIWAATQAVRQRSRIVEFQSGAQILEEFGLPHNGVSYRRLTDGFKRVFGSTIYFGSGDDSGRQDVFDCARFCFFDRLRVWYSRDDHNEGNLAGLPNRIELSERFWEEIRAHPIPGELNVVRGLANSPGCLDFYLWLTWRCHLARGDEKIRLFGPTGLQVQLGSDDYLRARDFRRTIARWIATVKACWPECPVRLAPDGENLHVSPASAIHKRL